MRYSKYFLLPVIAIIVAGIACGLGGQPATPTATPSVTNGSAPTPLPTPTPMISATPVPEVTATPSGPYGPTGFPAEINPLTGLSVSDPNILNKRPILVKVSNESPQVRPQSGLSFADNVWEYQMEGWGLTRYAAVFYSQSPMQVGSVRSARLPDLEHLVDMYGAILVNSGASSNRYAPDTPPRIQELLRAEPWADRVISQDYIKAAYNEPYFIRLPDVPRPGTDDYHTLFANLVEIWKLANEKGFNQRPNLDGFLFNYTPPAGGIAATEVNIDYHGVGPKHIWRYDTATNKWLSWTEDQQAHIPETPDVDYLTSQQIAFDNVVIVHAFAYDGDYIEDEAAQLPGLHINLCDGADCLWGNTPRFTLLRDGMRYDGTWKHTEGTEGMMQFFDVNGNPMAFKPGTIWFNVVSSNYAQPVVAFLPQ